MATVDEKKDATEKPEKKPEKIEKIELKVPKEITDKGWLVSLFYIDTTVFENPGGVARGTQLAMQELKKSLSTTGQLQSIHASPSDDGESLDVVCGFRRTEALRQIALDKLVRAYNTAKSLKPGDEGFIAINDHIMRDIVGNDESEIPDTDGDTWKNAYQRALKETKILVSIEAVVDTVDAALKNLVENQQREDFTLTELTARIGNLLSQDVPQKRIAKGLSVSEPKVSQMIKIGKLTDYLHDLLIDSDEGIKSMGLGPDETANLSGQITSAIEEIKRRMALPEGNRCCVKFSHMREFSGRVIVGKGKKQMPLSAVIFTVETLARMIEGKIKENKETMDYGAFITVMDDSVKRADKLDKATDAKDTAAADIKEAENVSTTEVKPKDTSIGDIADEQAKVAEANAIAEDKEEVLGDKPDTAEDTEVDTEKTVDAAAAKAEDAANAAAVKAENEATMDELAGFEEGTSTEGAAGEGKAVKPVGQTTTKTIDAPEEAAFTVKDPAKIKGLADQYMEYAASEDETVLLADKACFLHGASELYAVVGMTTEADEAHKAYVEYIESFNTFIEALKNACKKHVEDKEELKELAKLQPVYPVVEE